MATPATFIEVYKAKDGYRYRVKSRNGNILSASESYTRKASAVRGARRAHPSLTVKG